jgi:hypothetical protein
MSNAGHSNLKSEQSEFGGEGQVSHTGQPVNGANRKVRGQQLGAILEGELPGEIGNAHECVPVARALRPPPLPVLGTG